jgi:iron complex outermembrane receptor protein
MQTRKPTEVLQGAARMSYATQNTQKADVWLSGPLAQGVGFVLAGDYFNTDGFYRNAYLGNAKLVDYQHGFNVNGRVCQSAFKSAPLSARKRAPLAGWPLH